MNTPFLNIIKLKGLCSAGDRIAQPALFSSPVSQCASEEVSSMTRVLVAVEMLRCNRNPRHLPSSVPGLSSVRTSPTVAGVQMGAADAEVARAAHRPCLPLIMCQYLLTCTVAA